MTINKDDGLYVCSNPECDEDTCQECCPHDDLDHGICLSCEKDMNDWLAGRSEAIAEGNR